jgi:hypothetical protein
MTGMADPDLAKTLNAQSLELGSPSRSPTSSPARRCD